MVHKSLGIVPTKKLDDKSKYVKAVSAENVGKVPDRALLFISRRVRVLLARMSSGIGPKKLIVVEI